jgi:hypothetical protein
MYMNPIVAAAMITACGGVLAAAIARDKLDPPTRAALIVAGTALIITLAIKGA